MREELTEKQKRILEFIIQEIQIKGYPPSIREIGQALGITSLRGVTDHLDALEKKGHIRRGLKARSIKVLSPDEDKKDKTVLLPLLGRVAAGEPILAEENIEKHIPVNKRYSKKQDNLFLLRVKGDSMIDDQIFDGDLVVVNSQQTANNGDIIVALLDDEATVKRFYKMGNRPVLIPANPKYPIIEKEFIIQGRVVDVIPKESQEGGV